MVPSWPRSNNFLIWILTVAATSRCIFDELRDYFIERLAESLNYTGVATFQDFVGLISEFLWCEEACGPELRSLEPRLCFS